MNATKRLVGKIGILLCSALLGHATYGQPSVSVGVSVPLPIVEIHAASDFYEPLSPQGEWVVVGSYGRCWRPGHVARDWRPYCNGNWERTDAGWYWVSEEPWAWATYHYGRWDFTDEYGWYWVPQTQWAPAWVSWHEGGGYVGWAPLQPSVRISAGGFVGFNEARISPRAFVFVEQRRFLEPIRPATVVVNNTTVISKTTTITNTRIVNNTVINEGPAPAVIGTASGRKIQTVPAQELRHRTEAQVVAKRSQPGAVVAKETVPAVRGQTAPSEQQAVVARELKSAEKPASTPLPNKPSPKTIATHGENAKPLAAIPEVKPEAGTATNRLPVVRESNQPEAARHIQPQQKPAKPADKKLPQPVRKRPPTNDKNGANPTDKDHENKPKE